MGLKLRTQIAGILFLLFTLTVVTLGWFNVSLLYDAVKALSEEESNTQALASSSWVERRLPVEGYNREFLRVFMAQHSDVADYLEQVKGLRSFDVLAPSGDLLWSYRSPVAFPLHAEAVAQAIEGGRPYGVLWVVSPSADLVGHPVEGNSELLFSKGLVFVYYRVVQNPSGGPALAIMRLSLRVDELPRRLRFMIVGNLLLSAIFLVTAFIAISIWTANAINRPIESILQGQERIGRGDFSAHVAVDIPSTNEIVSISTSFNRMSADLRRFKKELEVKTVRLEQLNFEYRRLNERLETEVEEKTRELKEFFSVVTHDMKVPLAAIQGYADLLKRSRRNPLDEKQLRFVQGISSACAHLLGMTRNMLDSVKYDAGKISYDVEAFDLEEGVAEVTSQIRPQAEDKRIRVRYDVPPLCQWVEGDRTKIVQVITNLAINAVKFTPDGGAIEIRARDRGLLVEVEVADSGVGIAEAQIPHLFEKFTQFHTQEGAASSTGLGLYIVHKILEGHGQSIRVESRPGQGSTFTFTLAKASHSTRVESLDTLVSSRGGSSRPEGRPVGIDADPVEGGGEP